MGKYFVIKYALKIAILRVPVYNLKFNILLSPCRNLRIGFNIVFSENEKFHIKRQSLRLLTAWKRLTSICDFSDAVAHLCVTTKQWAILSWNRLLFTIKHIGGKVVLKIKCNQLLIWLWLKNSIGKTALRSFLKRFYINQGKILLWFCESLFLWHKMISKLHYMKKKSRKFSIINAVFIDENAFLMTKGALWMVSWMVFVVENAFERHLSLKMWTFPLAYLFVVCWCFMFYSEEIRRKDNEMCKVRDRPPCISNILSGWKIRKSTDNHGSWIQM